MDLTKTTRQFYPDELNILKSLLTMTKKEAKTKIKYYHFIIVGILGAFFTYLAILTQDSFWVLPFGTIAVFAFAFIVFMPYEIYKKRKKSGNNLQILQNYIDKKTVDIYKVKSTRIALASEYEDESDLYIIELDKEKVLYLWDKEYNLNKKFPCLDFEIYEDKFYKLIGRQIYPLSDKIQPIKIDKKAKWNYMKQYGIFEHLEIENISFDELLDKYNNSA